MWNKRQYQKLACNLQRIITDSARSSIRIDRKCYDGCSIVAFPKSALVAVFLLIFVALVFSGCKKKERPPIVDEPDPDIIVERPDAMVPKWLPGDYAHIAVVFGVGYETEELRQPVIDFFADEFGLAADGGLIETYVFPAEYFNGKRIRVSFLTETLKNKNICGLVLLCAPDRAYYALMDLSENGVSYPVWSVFPVTYTTDEVLGTEYGSFFVLDYKELSEEKNSDADSALIDKMDNGEKTYEGSICDILTPVIHYIKKSADGVNEPYGPGYAAEYLSRAYKDIFADCTLSRFIEQESGLPALNHYVLGIYK